MTPALPHPDLTGDYILAASRVTQEANHGTIRTFSGRYVCPLALRAEDICVVDVAHHLACINRYTGAAPEPYNVAQHSFIVAGYFRHRGPRIRLAALFHDGSEYVLNDPASPVKRDPQMAPVRDAHDRAQAVIFQWLGIEDLLPEIEAGGQVKAIDDLVFHREVASFWGKISFKERIVPMSFRASKRMFLDEYRSIARDLPGLPEV